MNNNQFDFSKLSIENKLAITGIVVTILIACIGGIFSLVTTLVGRSTSPAPTQIVIIINATPFPTVTPISTLSSSSSQPAPIPTILPTDIPNSDNPTNNKFSVPWSNWIIDFIVYMPQGTWIVLTIFFGILFLFAGIAIFYSLQGEVEFKIWFSISFAILALIFSIIQWGWVGLLWWILFMIAFGLLLSIQAVSKYILGIIVGVVAGMLLGTSFSLFYMVWIGVLDKEMITSWSVIGTIICIIIGIIIANDDSFSFY